MFLSTVPNSCSSQVESESADRLVVEGAVGGGKVRGSLLAGETRQMRLTLHNTSPQPVTSVAVSVKTKTKLSPADRDKVFKVRHVDIVFKVRHVTHPVTRPVARNTSCTTSQYPVCAGGRGWTPVSAAVAGQLLHESQPRPLRPRGLPGSLLQR